VTRCPDVLVEGLRDHAGRGISHRRLGPGDRGRQGDAGEAFGFGPEPGGGAGVANVTALGRLVLGCVAELGEHDAGRLAAAVIMVTGAMWTHAQPSVAMLAAYQADPALASMRLDFTATLREVIEVLIAGLMARSAR